MMTCTRGQHFLDGPDLLVWTSALYTVCHLPTKTCQDAWNLVRRAGLKNCTNSTLAAMPGPWAIIS